MKTHFKYLTLLIFILGFAHSAIPSSNRTWVRVGSLQSPFDAWGAEQGWNSNYGIYEGLQWPAWYNRSDNFVIDRQFMGCKDFTDTSGAVLNYKSVKFSRNANATQVIPQLLEQYAKYPNCSITVNGYNQDIDDYIGDNIDPSLPADRKVVNSVRTGMGVDMTRTIYAFSQPYHDNYFILEYTFTNTGNIDDDDAIELTNQINDFYFGLSSRYSTSRECEAIANMRTNSWGAHQWVHHTPMSDDPEIPHMYSWLGQLKTYDITMSYNNVGAPFLPAEGSIDNARLRCPQFVGMGVLHADKAWNDDSYDKTKIRTGWWIGDTYPFEGADQQVYGFLTNNYLDMGTFDTPQDIYHEIADRDAPNIIIIDKDGAGTNSYFSFGPYDIPHGESVKIVLVEGVSGLSRKKAIEVGKKWYLAYQGNTVDLDLPGPSPYRAPESVSETATDYDIYKDSWVYTGKDSIIQTFIRAKEMYDSGFDISLPPPPPSSFELTSQSGQVMMEWDNNSVQDPDFEGYRIYRAMHQRDSSYHIIFDCNLTADNCTTSYVDEDILPNVEYYYYVVAYKHDTEQGILESGRAYTQTNTSATQVGIKDIILPQICILEQNHPNPFNPTTTLQYGLPEVTDVNLMIFDITGRKIKEWSISNQQAGWHEVIWDGTDQSGSLVSTGVYIYCLQAGNFVDTKKMVFMK